MMSGRDVADRLEQPAIPVDSDLTSCGDQSGSEMRWEELACGELLP